MYYERLRTGNHNTLMPAGQVPWAKCPIPSFMGPSDTLEDNAQLAKLESGEGLLEIQSLKKPYVTRPVRNA